MKRILAFSLAIITVLLTLASCSTVNKFMPGAAKEVETEELDDIFIETEEIVPETEEPEEKDPVVLSDFLGNWHPGSDSGNMELRILSADSFYVEFSLWVADKGEINNVYAVVNGSTASFDMSASENTIAGELVFEESLITLNIEKSKISYIGTGEIRFDGKHSSSYQEAANAKKEEEEAEKNRVPVADGVVSPVYTVSPFDKYVNTPNNVLYLRKGPAKSYEGIEKMPDQSMVEVLGFNGDRSWCYVYYYAKGVYGWCSDEYLIY